MFKVNGWDFVWEEGLTVKKLLERKEYISPLIMVTVNGKLISPDDYEDTGIKDGDNVKTFYMITEEQDYS